MPHLPPALDHPWVIAAAIALLSGTTLKLAATVATSLLNRYGTTRAQILLSELLEASQDGLITEAEIRAILAKLNQSR